MPSSASDRPNRAPIRSSRVTSSQLVARLTMAASTNTTARGPSDTTALSRQHAGAGRVSGPVLRAIAVIWVHGSVPQGTPTRLPGSPGSKYRASVAHHPNGAGARRSRTRSGGSPRSGHVLRGDALSPRARRSRASVRAVSTRRLLSAKGSHVTNAQPHTRSLNGRSAATTEISHGNADCDKATRPAAHRVAVWSGHRSGSSSWPNSAGSSGLARGGGPRRAWPMFVIAEAGRGLGSPRAFPAVAWPAWFRVLSRWRLGISGGTVLGRDRDGPRVAVVDSGQGGRFCGVG